MSSKGRFAIHEREEFLLAFSRRTSGKGSLELASFAKVEVKRGCKEFRAEKKCCCLIRVEDGKGVNKAAKIQDWIVVSRKQFLLVVSNEWPKLVSARAREEPMARLTIRPVLAGAVPFF